jgi:hypothetical protein
MSLVRNARLLRDADFLFPYFELTNCESSSFLLSHDTPADLFIPPNRETSLSRPLHKAFIVSVRGSAYMK